MEVMTKELADGFPELYEEIEQALEAQAAMLVIIDNWIRMREGSKGLLHKMIALLYSILS